LNKNQLIEQQKELKYYCFCCLKQYKEKLEQCEFCNSKNSIVDNINYKGLDSIFTDYKALYPSNLQSYNDNLTPKCYLKVGNSWLLKPLFSLPEKVRIKQFNNELFELKEPIDYHKGKPIFLINPNVSDFEIENFLGLTKKLTKKCMFKSSLPFYFIIPLILFLICLFFYNQLISFIFYLFSLNYIIIFLYLLLTFMFIYGLCNLFSIKVHNKIFTNHKKKQDYFMIKIAVYIVLIALIPFIMIPFLIGKYIYSKQLKNRVDNYY